MGHLLTVQNLLVLLGAPISFDREMMPWDHEFYPFPVLARPAFGKNPAVFHLCRDAEACSDQEAPQILQSNAQAAGDGSREEARKSREVDQRPSKSGSVSKRSNRELNRRFNEQENQGRPASGRRTLYDQIIELISDPGRIPNSVFNEASYDMQADWDDWGSGYKPPPRASRPMAMSTRRPAPAERRPHPLSVLDGPPMPMSRSRARRPAPRPSRS